MVRLNGDVFISCKKEHIKTISVKENGKYLAIRDRHGWSYTYELVGNTYSLLAIIPKRRYKKYGRDKQVNFRKHNRSQKRY